MKAKTGENDTNGRVSLEDPRTQTEGGGGGCGEGLETIGAVRAFLARKVREAEEGSVKLSDLSRWSYVCSVMVHLLKNELDSPEGYEEEQPPYQGAGYRPITRWDGAKPIYRDGTNNREAD